MKKLNSIKTVTFNGESIFFEGVPISIGQNIEDWLNEYCSIDYIADNSMFVSNPNRGGYEFNNIQGISIIALNKLISRISVYPSVPNDTRYYQGDVIVFDKKLPKPFLSDEIELYFPGIVIEKPPYGYWKRFKANESVDYPISDKLKIEISMERRPEYVGGISLKEI